MIFGSILVTCHIPLHDWNPSYAKLVRQKRQMEVIYDSKCTRYENMMEEKTDIQDEMKIWYDEEKLLMTANDALMYISKRR